MKNTNLITENILNWYDRNARILPWRIMPKLIKDGLVPNPYYIWLSEIMLQQTTIKAVKPYFSKFINRWPDVFQLSNALDDAVMREWAGLGYYARARNLLKCSRIIVNEYGGVFPNDHKILLSLPGIGAYTSAAIMAIAYNSPYTVVDGNVERVICRLFKIKSAVNESKKIINLRAESLTSDERAGDYAQGIMDLGSTICTPLNPKCFKCPIESECEANKNNLTHLLPIKNKKEKLPVRYGYIYICLTSDNSILLERRPESGLLGGMMCLPSSEWTAKRSVNPIPPIDSAEWHSATKIVKHTFSHFHLELKILKTKISEPPKGYIKKNLTTFNITSLPKVMQKAFILGISEDTTI